jgi:hypothetical protein
MADLPETMRDRGAFWNPVPDWQHAHLQRNGFAVRRVAGLGQTLISGNVEAGAALILPGTTPVGLWDRQHGDRALVRIARDKALLVSPHLPAIAFGWNDVGFVASSCDDAFAVLDLSGPALRDVVAQATAVDLEAGSPSASILFAGVPALLYRASSDVARLHVEAPIATHVWTWLEGA